MCKIIKNCVFLTIMLFVFSCKKNNTNPTYACQKHTELNSKKYNEVCFVMTHNAMNNSEKGYSIPEMR